MYQDQDQTRPYGTPTARVFMHNIRHGRQGRLVIVAAAVALLALALAAASLTFLLSYRSTAGAQISQMQRQLGAMSQRLQSAQKAQNAEASSYSGLSGKVDAMSASVGALTQYNITCAQALESQAGPGTYYFPCSATRP
jgi:hypothetical protein